MQQVTLRKIGFAKKEFLSSYLLLDLHTYFQQVEGTVGQPGHEERSSLL